MLDRISRTDPPPRRPGPRRVDERERDPRHPDAERSRGLRRPGAGWRLTSRGERRLLWVLGTLAVLLLAAAFAWRHLDEYLRRTIEAKVNQRLTGYTVRVTHAHLAPLDLSLTLAGVIRQQAHPEPPVAVLPRLTASVQWKELLRFHLVADAVFDRPRVHVNLPQLRSEDQDKVDVQDRGWQDALESIYPLKFNRVEVRDADVVYVDTDPKRPLHVSQLNFNAENIRNMHSRDRTYPSPIHAQGIVFGAGRAVLDGHADFLAKPYPGFHFLYRAEKIPLDRLRPLGDRANLRLRGGVLASHGEVEYGPRHREVRLDDVTVSGLRLDYIHTAATASAEKRRGEEMAAVAKDTTPETKMRIVRLRLRGSELGMVDRSGTNPYRLYIDHTDLDMTNLSAGFVQGPAHAEIKGRFLSTGATKGSVTFRADRAGPDFNLAVAIEGGSLPAANDFLRNYGKFDVVKGTFSIYTEIQVRNGQITGYVKPLFKDIDVYDSRQDKKKPVLKKLYEKVVGGLSHILENKPREQVATVVDVRGTIADPKTSTWTTVVRLVSNAFVKAILPGFQREYEAAAKRR